MVHSQLDVPSVVGWLVKTRERKSQETESIGSPVSKKPVGELVEEYRPMDVGPDHRAVSGLPEELRAEIAVRACGGGMLDRERFLVAADSGIDDHHARVHDRLRAKRVA